MGSFIAAFLGGGAPKVQGPGEAALKAQQQQADRLEAQEKKEKQQASATQALIAARSGRGRGITLNPLTGERGVITAGKLGGAT